MKWRFLYFSSYLVLSQNRCDGKGGKRIEPERARTPHSPARLTFSPKEELVGRPRPLSIAQEAGSGDSAALGRWRGLRPSPHRSTVSCSYSRDSIRPSSWTGCTWVFWGQGHLAPGMAPSVDKMRSTQAFVDWMLFSWSFLTSPSLTGTCFINDCLKVLRFTFYLQIMQNHRRTARMACRVFSFSFLFFSASS